jgi:drug/metabolite transporter (DMT)-like permease
MSRPRTQVTAYAGVLASLLAAALVLAPWNGPAVIGALVLACVPAGAGMMCWVDAGETAAQAGLTLIISLAAIAVASAVMIWTHTWDPKALLVLAIASMLSCLVRLRREAVR